MFVREPAVQERERGNLGFNIPILSDPYTFPVYEGDIPETYNLKSETVALVKLI